MCGQFVEMTTRDARCDLCGALLQGLAGSAEEDPNLGVRFSYHPGDPRMRDDSGMVCGTCWEQWSASFGEPRQRACALCATAVTRRNSLHLRRFDSPGNGWQLCAPHAAQTLNELRTVEPKLDPATFRLPLDRQQADV
jgi:hypothetical protein